MDGMTEPPLPPMAPSDVEALSEEAKAQQDSCIRQAIAALEDGEQALALERLTEAIVLGCPSPSLYTKRAQILLKEGRPSAAINDCTAALALAPGSGKVLKIRARSHAKLGDWVSAHADFQEALSIDFDDVTYGESLEAAERAIDAQMPATTATSPCQLWEIVGGAGAGGLVVHEGLELSSPEARPRLAPGSTVEEVELVGDRLHYRRASGDGPDEGWISIASDDNKVLAWPIGGLPEDESGDEEAEEPPFPAMSPPTVGDLSDQALEDQSALKQQAIDAIEDGSHQLALDKFTAAISMGCASALMYSRRAQILLQLSRPRAAINDCTAALEINPDSGKAFKIRARAHTTLEQWKEAQSDFMKGLQIDYDDETRAESLEVDARVREAQAAEALAAGLMWEIVGGADKGGVLVRQGLSLSSPEESSRLSTGAMVQELEAVGERLHYRRATGSGPDEGWISISLKDKVLACRVSAGSIAVGAMEEAEEPLADEPPFPAMPPEGVEELTDEALDRQAALKQEAADALEDGNLELALEKSTGAISLGCASALMYSRRAQTLLQLGRPRAAINDCTAALGVNPDSGKAFKIRARAHVRLKHWTEAHSDFQVGLGIDYDEGTYEESLSVAAKMKDIQAVVTSKRVKSEKAADQRKLKQAQEAYEARKRAEQLKAEKLKEAVAARPAHLAKDPIVRYAQKQGYMTDFMGCKRGKCKKCAHCEVYTWRPVRLSS